VGLAMWILIAATLFSVVFTSAGARSLVIEIVQGFTVNRWVIIIGLQVILFIFGMFMDDFAVVTICAPIFISIVMALGFNPLWFAIIFILNMQFAYLSPPFGWSLLLMKGITPPSVTMKDLWKSVPPFLVLQLVTLILTMVFPQLALYLPSKM
jgi:TRAP-type mannitol/chloroaromatic compound transport system permease large subunit